MLEPIANPKELDLSVGEAVGRLAHDESYRARFTEAFGAEVNAANLARALASYVRTILSGDSPLDRYMNGERAALSAEEQAGLQIFRGKGNCVACHVGPNFTDEKLHNTGVAWRNTRLTDLGAGHGAFKTPTLREVASTAPYMHDGSLATLEAAVDFYDDGGRPNLSIDPEIHPLHCSVEEKQALVAFLKSLSGSIREGQL